ncbi:hypothetical protein CDL15_Pgr021943 [Punica granatum]|uniref:Uncharacterized protein n=1 Tax=Punica granatum TaxID=22663 RepID=A0A218WDJ3_PUNGR|nr:hypothetical protein CDL15_Pgr021943 [Punica granatum]
MAEAPKPEEISHPPMDQLQGLEYCIDSNPSWGEQSSSSSFALAIPFSSRTSVPAALEPKVAFVFGFQLF